MASSALSIAVSALRAQSYAVETTSQNIANASTPGYRRQRVELTTAFPRQGALGPMGAGVQAKAITRVTDNLADLRVRNSSAQAAYFGTRAQVMTQAEDVFGEPDQGITKELSATYDAFATLATQPSDDAARYEVLSALQGTAARVNQVRNGLDQLTADASKRLSTDVDEANAITARLAEINQFSRVQAVCRRISPTSATGPSIHWRSRSVCRRRSTTTVRSGSRSTDWPSSTRNAP